MCRWLIVFASTLAAPAVASGSAELQIGPQRRLNVVDAAYVPGGSTTGHFDLVFNVNGSAEHEQLFTYDIDLLMDRGGRAGGVSLVTGPGAVAIPPENFVLPATPPAMLSVLEKHSGTPRVQHHQRPTPR